MYRQNGSSSRPPTIIGTTEFDILKASHKFLRDDDAEGGDVNGSTGATATAAVSWEDRLAQKYYASLYREFAVCDLKHYKSGNFALRWRTESEVIEGKGEETCGNTRCKYHHAPLPSSPSSPSSPFPMSLKTVELPFAYEEHGERKSALVKVVLCERCLSKLVWKHEREKEEREGRRKAEENEKDSREDVDVKVEEDEDELRLRRSGGDGMGDVEKERRRHRKRDERDEEDRQTRRRRNSRSLSPSSHRRRREHKDKHKGHGEKAT